MICYLTDFALLSDSLHETFQQEWDNLNDQNQQKIKLYDEIEELKNQIANEIQNLQCKKDEKPSVIVQNKHYCFFLLTLPMP